MYFFCSSWPLARCPPAFLQVAVLRVYYCSKGFSPVELIPILFSTTGLLSHTESFIYELFCVFRTVPLPHFFLLSWDSSLIPPLYHRSRNPLLRPRSRRPFLCPSDTHYESLLLFFWLWESSLLVALAVSKCSGRNPPLSIRNLGRHLSNKSPFAASPLSFPDPPTVPVTVPGAQSAEQTRWASTFCASFWKFIVFCSPVHGLGTVYSSCFPASQMLSFSPAFVNLAPVPSPSPPPPPLYLTQDKALSCAPARETKVISAQPPIRQCFHDLKPLGILLAAKP